MKNLHEAILVAQSGQRETARALFEQLLPEIADRPAMQCILAHYMADLQDDGEAELTWDLSSLRYLNVANCYWKLGDRENTLKHLTFAEESCSDLESDDYGNFVRSRIALLAAKCRTR